MSGQTILPRPPANFPLNGLYRAFPAVAQFGAAIGEAYIFFANGNVYKGWPGAQMPESFDFARAKIKEPKQTGRYHISGDKITFAWSSHETETASFRNSRDSKTGKTTLSIGPYYAYKLVTWNRPLEGTFVPNTYQGGFDEQAGPPKLVDPITFTRDGRFAIVQDDKTLLPVKGQYKISGSALLLFMPDGKQRTYSLHVFEDHKQPPTTVLINGRPFASVK